MPEKPKFCPVCSKKSPLSLEETIGNYGMYLCGSCDVVFSQPFEHPGKKVYETTSSRYLIPFFWLTWDHKQFTRLRLPPGRLLDIGCGPGNFLFEMGKKGFKLHGIEIDKNAIFTARNSFHIENMFSGTLEEFRKKNKGKFNYITFFELLEHLDEPRKFLLDVRSLLEDNGYIALAVPNRLRRPRLNEKWDVPPFHLTKWSVKSLRNVLDSAGFETIVIKQGGRQTHDLIDRMKERISFVHSIGGGEEVAPNHMELNTKRLASLARYYHLLHLISEAVVKVFGIPLKLSGATGSTIFVLARKKPVK